MSAPSSSNQRRRRLRWPALGSIFLAGLVLVLLLSPARSSLRSIQFSTAEIMPPLDQVALGTNLTSVNDWSPQLPFLDAFKSSRPWVMQCTQEDPGCNGVWDTQEIDQLDLDEHNWVKSLPAPQDEPIFTRVGTLLLIGQEGRYPGGQYVVLYEGEGTIEYGFDAQKDEALSRPGRDLLNVTPSNNGIYLTITATDPHKTGNYIRNIHVVPIAYENTFREQIFNPTFIERIDRFQALRFMDWMQTNNSTQKEWRDRPQVEDATYATPKGVPLEIMVALANRVQAHPWFNMPIQATDEYMREFARLVKDQLDPKLRAYVELSNEVWNWQFSQSHYALDTGKARWGQDKADAFMQWYGMRTAQMSDLWKQAFGDQRDRVVTVISTQTVWRTLEESALDCSLWVAEGHPPCHESADVYAVAGYFSGNLNQPENQAAVEALLNEPDGGFNKAFTQMEQGSIVPSHGYDDTLPGVSDAFAYHLNVAKQRNLQLVVYEGGQHLVSADNEKLTDFFIALNRQPQMGKLYDQLLQRWTDGGGTLFMNFSDIAGSSRWGSWGVLEHVDQAHSPRYDALMRFLDKIT
ncbi:MAG: cellulose-binding protein [Microcoleus sp. SIO2G3]|nr:cellulose-binding protein [Microcoleus sp. SIO2G3]